MVFRDKTADGTIRLTGGPGGGGAGSDGLSAYEIAVANGFVGTEVEWLDSLVGEDGVDSTVAGPPGVVLVAHGTDPNVARPTSPVVYWVGTANPVNALSTDWYKQS